MRLAILGLLLLLATLACGQVLSGEVRDISTFTSCSSSPLASQAPMPPVNNVTRQASDRTPCGLLGDASNVTAITVFLQTDQVAGGDSLVFKIQNIPSDPSTYNATDGTLCSGTLNGADCEVLAQPLVITFATSALVNSYSLYEDPQPLAYAQYWRQCSGIPESQLDDALQAPASNRGFHIVTPSSTKCATFTSQPAVEGCDAADSECNPCFNTINNLASTGKAGKNVCPAPGDINNIYFPDPSPGSNPPSTTYTSWDSTCNLLLCPNSTLEGDGASTWNAGYVTSLLPVCNLFRIQEAPRSLVNVEVLLESVLPSSGNGTNTVDTVVTASTLQLSSLQDGALVPDPSGTIVGGIIDVKTPTGSTGQPLSGSIVTCNTCNEQDALDGVTSKCGLLSDIAGIQEDDAFLAQADNPWLRTDAGIAAVQAGCTVPTQLCRQMLLDDPTEPGFWMYYNQADTVAMFGDACSKNGMSEDIYVRDPTVAEFMCAGGMAGTCVPGYQQTINSQFDTFTPCELMLSWADKLVQKNDPTSDTQSVSFSPGTPEDFNQDAPQYWVNGVSVLRDSVGTGGSVEIEVELYVGGEYMGERVSFASGKFEDTSIYCSTPDDNTGGEALFTVRNTGASVGSYRVEATFVQGSTPYSVTDNSSPVTFQVAAGGLSEMQVITYAFSGPIGTDLQVILSLYTDVQIAFQSGATDPLQQVVLGCFITSPVSEGGIFGAISASTFVGDGDDDLLDGDDSDDYCPFYQISFFGLFPFGCTPEGFSNWIGRLLWWFLILLVGTLVVVGFITSIQTTKSSSSKIKAQAQAEKNYEAVRSNKEDAIRSNLSSGQGRASRSGGGGSVLFSPLLLLCLVAISGCSAASVDILGVSSFRECIPVQQPDGTALDCGASDFVTTLDLRIEAPTSTSADSDTVVATFDLALSTVPNQDSGEVQRGNGTVCPAADDTPCQLSTPATMTVEVSEAVLIYRLVRQTAVQTPYFDMAYSYFYNPFTLFKSGDGGSISALLDADANSGGVQCRYAGFSFNSGQPQEPGSHADQADINVQGVFASESENRNHIRCGASAQAPRDTSNSFCGSVSYDFICDWTDEDNLDREAIIEWTASFKPLAPSCGFYRIENPPQVAANMRFNVTTQLPGGAGTTESATIQTITVGQQGTTAVSEPNRLVSASVINVLTPDGLVGPDFQGYIVVCDDDDENPGYLDMTNGLIADPEAFGALSFNPWQRSSAVQQGVYVLPEPEGLDFLVEDEDDATSTAGVNEFTMFHYLNASMTPSIGPRCGQEGVDECLYADPPTVLEFNALLTSNPQQFMLRSLVTDDQCSVDEPTLCGTGEFENVLTCVPGFGAGFLNTPPVTPCNVMDAFRRFTTQMNGLPQRQANSLLVEWLPYQWANNQPNMWLSGATGSYALYYAPRNDEVAFEVLATITGELVDYPQQVTNGAIDTGSASTFCFVNVTSGAFDGAAFYRVCNTDKFGSAADYDLLVECGLRTDFDSVTGEFTGPATVVVTPSRIPLNGVAAGACATVASPGASLPLLRFIDTDNILDPDTGASNVQCNYKLLSTDTVVPADVFLSEASAVCSTSFVQSFVFGNGTALAPNVLDPFPDGPPPPPPPPSDGASTAFKVVAGIAAGIAILVIVGAFVAACFGVFRSRRQDKKIAEQGTAR